MQGSKQTARWRWYEDLWCHHTSLRSNDKQVTTEDNARCRSNLMIWTLDLVSVGLFIVCSMTNIWPSAPMDFSFNAHIEPSWTVCMFCTRQLISNKQSAEYSLSQKFKLNVISMLGQYILFVNQGRLKMREWKMRYGQNCKGGKCRSGKCRSRQQGWKMQE